MKTSSLETVLGALILVIAAVFLLYSVKAGDAEKTEGYTINAQFNQVGGLAAGDAVRISGVKIGSIKAITLDKKTFMANVEASINKDIQVPADSAATVASSGLLGGNYLEISPGGDLENLKNKGSIQYTQDAQNLEKLLGQFIFSAADKKPADGQATPEAETAAPAAAAAPSDAPMPAM